MCSSDLTVWPLEEKRDILRAILRCVVGTCADAQTGQKE